MKEITFITGNQGKADYLAKYLDFPVYHHKLDLDEIQSLDLKEIVEHKVKQAYQKIHKPVIVEDVSLEFEVLNGLPGPFIRFFVDQMDLQDISNLLKDKSRKAIGKCVFGFYDGTIIKLFEGVLPGTIAETPAGDKGFGWDKIFIPEGYNITRASLSEEDYQKVYMKIRPLEQLKQFLINQ